MDENMKFSPDSLRAEQEAKYRYGAWTGLPSQRAVRHVINGPVDPEQLAPAKEPSIVELLAKHEQEIRHLHEINQHFGVLLAEAKQHIQFLRDRMGV